MSERRFRKHCGDPWFSWIAEGRKSVEGRLDRGDWKTVTGGDIIVFFEDGRTCACHGMLQTVGTFAAFSGGESSSSRGVPKHPKMPMEFMGLYWDIYCASCSAEEFRRTAKLAVVLVDADPD